MERLRKRKCVSLTLLSIVVPMSLLATFRLTGILQGPMTISETTTLDAVQWEFERPNPYPQGVPIDKKLDATYAADGLSTTLCLWIYDYVDSVAGHDFIIMAMRVNSTATDFDVFIESVQVVSGKDSQPSTVDWVDTYFDFKNLSLVDLSHGRTNGEDYKKAFVRLTGVNHPSKVYFSMRAVWFLLTPNIQTHQMELSYEVTYYNGTAYKKIIQPFQLKIVGK